MRSAPDGCLSLLVSVMDVLPWCCSGGDLPQGRVARRRDHWRDVGAAVAAGLCAVGVGCVLVDAVEVSPVQLRIMFTLPVAGRRSLHSSGYPRQGAIPQAVRSGCALAAAGQV